MTLIIDSLINSLGKSYKTLYAEGLITYKTPPTGYPGDPDLTLEMAKEVVEYMTTIIANTQQANRGLCANYIYELNENIKLTARIAKLEAENERLKEDLQHEKTRSRLNLEAEKRRMLNITYYCAEIDRLNARIAELEAEVSRLLTERDDIIMAEARYTARVELAKKDTRIAELEAERRWIPVGEKPLEAGTFFVLLKNGEVTKDFTFIDGGRYYWWNHGANITHYMPLPEPPIVYGKVCEE